MGDETRTVPATVTDAAAEAAVPRETRSAARRATARPAVRANMGPVMGDLVPAGHALDPRRVVARAP